MLRYFVSDIEEFTNIIMIINQDFFLIQREEK